MVKRPMVIITICYITSILGGIYFKKYIPFLCLILIILNFLYYKYLAIKKENHLKKALKRNRRLFNICIFAIFFSSIFISNKDKKFYTFNVENNTVNAIAIIEEVKPESEYYYNYIVKITKLNNKKCNKKMCLMIKKNKESKQFEYADLIQVNGSFEKGEVQRNYKGFSQFDYLKYQNIYGIIKGEKTKLLKHNSTNAYKLWINRVRLHIQSSLQELISTENLGIANALLLGDGSLITSEQKNIFSSANLSHILAISGMHVSYVILGISFLLKKISNRKRKYFLIILLFIYASITGGAPSILRAAIMSVLAIIASLIYRKPDTLNNISISAFLILLFNPYYLFNLGFQLSFLGTLGIVLFNTRINFMMNKYVKYIIKHLDNKKSKFFEIIKNKVIFKITSLISVSISANILIFPVLIYNFNKISFIFLFSNLLVTPILGLLVFSGYNVAIFSFISVKIAYIPSKIFNVLISCFQKVAEISSYIDLTKFTIGTPKISTIIFIYLLIFLLYYYSYFYSNFICHIKKSFRIFIIVISIFIILFLHLNSYNTVFTIRFIDVGQGDCTLIITSSNKKILIDGGGSETGNYNVGEKVLVPYLLDRKIKSVDFLIFSHFDSDHCLGLFTVIEKLKVKNAIISEQSKESGNYKYFCKLAKERKVNVVKVKAGNRLKIDDSTNIQFLWPVENQLTQNPLNNNSVVCKVFYKNISILFTGDIEEPAEQEIAKIYNHELKADILKVGHHGSITSSTEEFLKYVKPKIALIGVGKNNKFGHPSDVVINRLTNMRNENIQNR